MESVFRLIRGKKVEIVTPLASQCDKVWRVVKDGPFLKKGDVVCARRPMSLPEAAERVACWRTKVAPTELVLLKPVEGWVDGHGRGDLVQPYADLLSFAGSAQTPDPQPAA